MHFFCTRDIFVTPSFHLVQIDKKNLLMFTFFVYQRCIHMGSTSHVSFSLPHNISYELLYSSIFKQIGKKLFLKIWDTFFQALNCTFAKLFYCRLKIFSVQYCSININICAKINEIWASCQLVTFMLLWDTHIWPFFFQLFDHFGYFLKVPIIGCFSCIEQLILGTNAKKIIFYL